MFTTEEVVRARQGALRARAITRTTVAAWELGTVWITDPARLRAHGTRAEVEVGGVWYLIRPETLAYWAEDENLPWDGQIDRPEVDGKTAEGLADASGGGCQPTSPDCQQPSRNCQQPDANCQQSGAKTPKKRRTSYRPAPKTWGQCPVCGQGFAGRRGQKYCSPRCRNRAHYLRQHPDSGRQYAHTCAYCGVGFLSQRREARFCCDSHRVMFHKWERRQLISRTAGLLGIDLAWVEDYAERHGMRSLRALYKNAESLREAL